MSVQLLGKREIKRLGSVANDGAGAGYTSFAKGMMAKMGWAEGQGLGKDKQGRATYVQVKKKDDNAGLGKEKAQQNNVNDQWYFNAFDSALANMGGKKKKKKDKKKKRKAGEDGPAEEKTECMYSKMFKATGGARMGMRARASQNGKLARTEGGHDGVGETESATGAVEPGDGEKSPKSQKRKRATEAVSNGVGCVTVKQEKSAIKKERNRNSDSSSEDGGGLSAKAERKREKSEAKKEKRADKAVKIEGGVGEGEAERAAGVGEEKARKKKKKRAGKEA